MNPGLRPGLRSCAPNGAAVHKASENELEAELHRARVGLNIGDLTERAACLMHGIRCAVWKRGQTETGIRQSEVLMVERVEKLPSELEIAVFGEMELLG